MDQPEPIILLEEEPVTNVLGKWLAWMLVMTIFVMCLIYFSNYFAKSTECPRISRRRRHD